MTDIGKFLSDVEKIMKYVKQNKSKKFVPAGQSTQMIIGASSETDLEILKKSEKWFCQILT